MTKSTLTQLKEKINANMALELRQLAFLDQIADKLAGIELEATFYGSSLDFDYLTHENVIKVIRAIGGKWDKTPSGAEGKVDYKRDFGEFSIQCYGGQPPPNCKLVEYEEVVPAIPEHKVKRVKLICTPAATEQGFESSYPTPAEPEPEPECEAGNILEDA